MSDLIDREHVIDFLKLTRDSEYEKSMSAEVKHKSVIRSKHDAHVAFCDYLIEYVNQVPTHPTPSNTLGALDCIDRQEAIKALCREECGMDPKGCHVGTCYDVEIIEDVPSVQLELSNNSPELDNKNGELISRQAAIDAIDDISEEVADGYDFQYAKWREHFCELPSVQPERKRGEWIYGENDGQDGWYCSECGLFIPWYYDYYGLDNIDFIADFNTCPKCDTKMLKYTGMRGDSE